MAKIIAKTISKILFRFNLIPPFLAALHTPACIWTPILWLAINCTTAFTNPIPFFIFVSIFPDEFGCFVFHFDFHCSFSNSNSAVRVYMGIVSYNVGFVNIDFNFPNRKNFWKWKIRFQFCGRLDGLFLVNESIKNFDFDSVAELWVRDYWFQFSRQVKLDKMIESRDEFRFGLIWVG